LGIVAVVDWQDAGRLVLGDAARVECRATIKLLPDLPGYIPSFLGIVLTSMYTAPIGAKLAHKLPAEELKRYFSLLLFVMAAKLIWF